jgi:DNA-binding NarL/FixJ family response regulator
MPPFRILIADDSDIIRKALRTLLAEQETWLVCGECADGEDTVRKALELKPDAVLLDLSIPVIPGLQVARSLQKNLASCAIVILSEQDPDVLKHIAKAAGLSFYAAKTELGTELIPLLKKIEEDQKGVSDGG